MRKNDPQQEIETFAAKRLFSAHTVESPAVFNILMRELGEVRTPTSLVNIIGEVRRWDETIRYRDWLWRYYRAAAERKPLAQQKLLDHLGSHLDGMRKIGKGDTKFTSTVKVSVSQIIGMSRDVSVIRWIDNDFVGFIGEWYVPETRQSRQK